MQKHHNIILSGDLPLKVLPLNIYGKLPSKCKRLPLRLRKKQCRYCKRIGHLRNKCPHEKYDTKRESILNDYDYNEIIVNNLEWLEQPRTYSGTSRLFSPDYLPCWDMSMVNNKNMKLLIDFPYNFKVYSCEHPFDLWIRRDYQTLLEMTLILYELPSYVLMWILDKLNILVLKEKSKITQIIKIKKHILTLIDRRT